MGESSWHWKKDECARDQHDACFLMLLHLLQSYTLCIYVKCQDMTVQLNKIGINSGPAIILSPITFCQFLVELSKTDTLNFTFCPQKAPQKWHIP